MSGAVQWAVIHGDCLDVLKTLPDASFSAVVTDPPAGIFFMSASWDADKGGRDQWVKWLAEVMREALRVLKPGGHGLVWALPKTSHWTAWALEDAGFEIRDRISHMFGSGFPKSMDIGKALDKSAGAEREVVGPPKYTRGAASMSYSDTRKTSWDSQPQPQTAPATDAAEQWDGWGTALKPSVEDWWLVRKPLEGTVAANVLKHGAGGLHIDACRIAVDPGGKDDPRLGGKGSWQTDSHKDKNVYGDYSGAEVESSPLGRFPSHLVLSHSDTCQQVGQTRLVTDKRAGKEGARPSGFANVGADNGSSKPSGPIHGDEMIDVWDCVPDCPVRLLDEQSGVSTASQHTGPRGRRPRGMGETGERKGDPVPNGPTYADTGGASRFFYCAKPSTREREIGCETLKEPGAKRGNTHVTVKPLELMRYLVRMITPPGGIVLDPFAGSGTTGMACVQEGFAFFGIEQDAKHVAIAEARIAAALAGVDTSRKHK